MQPLKFPGKGVIGQVNPEQTSLRPPGGQIVEVLPCEARLIIESRVKIPVTKAVMAEGSYQQPTMAA